MAQTLEKGSNSFSNANSDNDMPVDVYGAFYQSVKLLKQGDAENALAILEGALGRTSDSAERGAIYYNIAVSHRRMGNDDLALQSLVNAVQARPKLGKEAKKDSDLSEIFSSREFRKRINEL